MIQFTIRRAGSVTSRIHALKPGDIVGIRGPYGKPFSPEPQTDPEIVFLCRGIGMATVIPFLHAVLDRKNHFTKIALWADPAGAFPKAGENPDFIGTIDVMRLEESSGNDSVMNQVGSLTRSGFHAERASVLLFCGPEENVNLSEALLRSGFRSECIFLWTERKMSCAIGQCRHCTIDHLYVCKEGPLLPMSGLRNLRG
jgi:NAD(P)H-flavin reductase